jgi:hypothetical protein
MKKIILIGCATLLMLVAFQFAGKAQVTGKARFGIKGGINFSDLPTKNSDKSKFLTGFNAGLFAKLPITPMFGIQPELLFTTKGSNVTYDNVFSNGTARFSLNYLEVPVLLTVNISDNFNIHVGPYASYLVTGKVKNIANVTLFNYEDNINTDDYNRLDVGIVLGVGIDIGTFGLGARYTYGLTKIGKEKTFLGNTYRFPDANNSVFNLYVALSLN